MGRRLLEAWDVMVTVGSGHRHCQRTPVAALLTHGSEGIETSGEQWSE